MTVKIIRINSMLHTAVSAIGDVLSLALYILGVGKFIEEPSFIPALCLLGVAGIGTVVTSFKNFYCTKAAEAMNVFEDKEAEECFAPLKKSYVTAVITKSSAEKVALPVCLLLLGVIMLFIKFRNPIYAIVSFGCMFTYVINFFLGIISSNSIIRRVEAVVSGVSE